MAAANDTALNALLAARAEHDARLTGFWKAAGEPKPATEGHHYRFDNPGNAEKVQEALAKLLADRGYQNGGAAPVSHHYFATPTPTSGEPIMHVGGGFRTAVVASVRPRASETTIATNCCERR